MFFLYVGPPEEVTFTTVSVPLSRTSEKLSPLVWSIFLHGVALTCFVVKAVRFKRYDYIGPLKIWTAVFVFRAHEKGTTVVWFLRIFHYQKFRKVIATAYGLRLICSLEIKDTGLVEVPFALITCKVTGWLLVTVPSHTRANGWQFV